jgi:membrane protease YdiL (CAAX protease family)
LSFQKTREIVDTITFCFDSGFINIHKQLSISAYLSSRTTLTEPIHTVFFYAVECLAIGFFEETVFRGVILLVLLQRLPQTKRGSFMAIIVSSALFGLTHLFNLFVGAAVPDTLIQVGYSFLMGAMWSVIYIATENLLFPILLHASYNFFGEVLFRLEPYQTGLIFRPYWSLPFWQFWQSWHIRLFSVKSNKRILPISAQAIPGNRLYRYCKLTNLSFGMGNYL